MISFILKVLLVAVTVAFLGCWGIIKQQRKPQELVDKLFNKSSEKIIKALKNNETLCDKQIDIMLKNIKTSLFWSKNQVTITDIVTMRKELISKMINKGMIISKKINGKVVYSLNKK